MRFSVKRRKRSNERAYRAANGEKVTDSKGRVAKEPYNMVHLERNNAPAEDEVTVAGYRAPGVEGKNFTVYAAFLNGHVVHISDSRTEIFELLTKVKRKVPEESYAREAETVEFGKLRSFVSLYLKGTDMSVNDSGMSAGKLGDIANNRRTAHEKWHGAEWSYEKLLAMARKRDLDIPSGLPETAGGSDDE